MTGSVTSRAAPSLSVPPPIEVARRRLTRKLLTFFLAPTLVCVVAFAGITAQLWRQALLEDANGDLADHVALLQATLEPIRDLTDLDLAKVIEQISDGEKIHGVAVYDRDGRALARSRLLASNPARIDEVARKTIGSGAEHLSVERVGTIDVLVRADVIPGPSDLAVVVVAHDLTIIEDLISGAVRRVAGLGSILLFIIGGLAFWLSQSLGRGLGDLVHAAEQVATGDLSVKIVESDLLELDRVARAFNDMTDALTYAQAELERANAQRRQLEARIQHAQALTIVGQVSASLAHEIGSPLNTILGYARLSQDDPNVPPGIREQLETIALQTERIARIVDRMLKVARPSSDRIEEVDVGEVVNDTAAFLRLDFRARRIDLEVALEASLPKVVTGRDRLMQLVLNLAVNAMQAQPDGGKVLIAARRVEGDTGTMLALDVADAGPGISPEVREKIFELFFTTKGELGTGLGLPIVAEIVRDLGGTIDVGRSDLGGALFSMRFPAVPTLSGRGAAMSPPATV